MNRKKRTTVQIVIPSKGRPHQLRKGALQLFPEALVCVEESEKDKYAKITPNLLVHPDKVTGIGAVRQWILDNLDDEIIVQVDDDVHAMYSLMGQTKRTIKDVHAIERVIATTALCAYEAGTAVFGFNQAWDVRKYNPHKPVSLNTWVGGVIGVIGRELKYNTDLRLRADIDFCLECLMKYRYVYVDSRYSFLHKRWSGAGGNALNRSQKRHESEMEFLKKKWGKYIEFRETKSAMRIITKVER